MQELFALFLQHMNWVAMYMIVDLTALSRVHMLARKYSRNTSGREVTGLIHVFSLFVWQQTLTGV